MQRSAFKIVINVCTRGAKSIAEAYLEGKRWHGPGGGEQTISRRTANQDQRSSLEFQDFYHCGAIDVAAAENNADPAIGLNRPT
jgi:hypothetical protein